MNIRLFKQHRWSYNGHLASKPWDELPQLKMDADLSLVEQVGRLHGEGLYLLISDTWNRELEIADVHSYVEVER